jgi:hypothetical protein
VSRQPTPRYACLIGSTVGWRLLHHVGEQLAPLPFLADIDGDGAHEVVLWTRLPWGSVGGRECALSRFVYVLDGDRLVRRDDKAAALRAKVGDAYRALDAKSISGMPHKACVRALATMH